MTWGGMLTIIKSGSRPKVESGDNADRRVSGRQGLGQVIHPLIGRDQSHAAMFQEDEYLDRWHSKPVLRNPDQGGQVDSHRILLFFEGREGVWRHQA